MWLTLSLLVIILVILPGIAYFNQERLIFPATRALYRLPSDPPYHWPYEEVLVPVGKHQTHGWYIPLENARGTVLFSHGNAGNIADRLESIHLLRRLGFSVLAYDYGGYGRSTGRPTEQRVYADVEAMWAYLREERGVPPEEIVLFGRSLGGAAAAHLGAKTTPAAVVLESTFLSIPEVVRAMPLGALLVRGLRHHFPNDEKVKDIQSPLLIVHSMDDTLIPYHHGQTLFEIATPPKQFLHIRGDHNDGFVISMDIYLSGWEAFLEPILPRAAAAVST